MNPICSKRLKSFTASACEWYGDLSFFPCQFNPIAFDILACDWLLFGFVLFMLLLPQPPSLLRLLLPKLSSEHLSLSLFTLCSVFFPSYFAHLSKFIFCTWLHHRSSSQKALLSTFKISKLLTFHRQCHNTLNFSHFSVFVIFSFFPLLLLCFVIFV